VEGRFIDNYQTPASLLGVVMDFFTIEVPSQYPDKSIDSNKQHKAEQNS
jgi:hypothetical protein